MPNTNIKIEPQLWDSITTGGTQLQSNCNPDEQSATGANDWSTLQFSGCSGDGLAKDDLGNMQTLQMVSGQFGPILTIGGYSVDSGSDCNLPTSHWEAYLVTRMRIGCSVWHMFSPHTLPGGLEFLLNELSHSPPPWPSDSWTYM